LAASIVAESAVESPASLASRVDASGEGEASKDESAAVASSPTGHVKVESGDASSEEASATGSTGASSVCRIPPQAADVMTSIAPTAGRRTMTQGYVR
jgi:hypothetical protein